MQRVRDRMGDEHGGVFVLVAIVLPLIVVMTAGGFSTFVLYAGKRELQQVADQAALAGGSAIPPLDPKVLVPNEPLPEAPHPLPSTNEIYREGVSRISDLVPDPRSVACHFGEQGLETSASLVGSFRTEPDIVSSPAPDPSEATDPVTDPVADVPETVCDDERVFPSVFANPDNTTAVDCTNKLLLEISEDLGEDVSIDPVTVGDITLDPVGTLQDSLRRVVQLDLNTALPALFTPMMRVDVYENVDPPLFSFVGGTRGGTLRATATAYRRIKNAVVVPIFPEQKALIESKAINPLTGEPFLPRDFMVDPFNLNTALSASQTQLLEALDAIDEKLDTTDVLDYGLPCKHLLHNVRRDIRDIYDPPSGPAPTGQQLVDEALRSAQSAAGRVAAPTPDPADPLSFPDAVASEAFVLIAVSVDEAMNPIAATQVPILDAALAVMGKVRDDDCTASPPTDGLLGVAQLGDFEPLPTLPPILPTPGPSPSPSPVAGCYRAALVSAANAYGAFRAVLVE